MQALVLGTAQWGLDYGVTNSRGRLPDEGLSEVAAAARRLGIDMLDTAPAYGDAEERIAALAPAFRVQTKVSGSQDDVSESIRRSAQRLGRTPERVLVHDWHLLDGALRRRTATHLAEAVQAGLVGAVGVSGYDEEDVTTAMEVFDRLDVVQLPVSVLDQRLVDSSAIRHLRAHGGAVQARSVYLQGLALAAPGDLPLSRHPDLGRFRDSCARAGLEPAHACRAFVRAQSWVDEIVVGVTSAGELEEWGSNEAREIEALDWSALASRDRDLVDPRRWTGTA